MISDLYGRQSPRTNVLAVKIPVIHVAHYDLPCIILEIHILSSDTVYIRVVEFVGLYINILRLVIIIV